MTHTVRPNTFAADTVAHAFSVGGDPTRRICLTRGFYRQKRFVSRESLVVGISTTVCCGATLLSQPCLQVLRRELRKISRDAKIQAADERVLVQEVIKREVTEGDKADTGEN